MKQKKIQIPFRLYFTMLSRYLKPQWKTISWLAVLLLASIAVQLINPQIVRYFIDTAKNANTSDKLWAAAGMFIGVSLLNQLFTVVAAYLGENIGWIATNQLREVVAEHCLRLDMSFHKAHTSGSLIERVDGDINSLTNFFSNFVITLMSNLLLIAGILILLFREGWLIGAGMTLFVIFALIAIQYVRGFAAPYWSRLREISSQFYGFLGEHLEGTEDTRANGATGFVMRRFHTMLKEWLPVRLRAFLGWALMWITTMFVFAVGNAVAFALSAYLWDKGAVTLGTVYMIFYYTELMAKPIEKIRTQIEDLQKADASITRIQDLLNTKSAIADGKGTPIPMEPLRVEFDHMTFGYSTETTTLNDINLRLEPGQVLGLLGRTGSGKTTMARLLLRFYDPTAGAIRLHGMDIRDAAVAELRKRVGLVTQNIEIFKGTIRDNLTFFDGTIPDNRILAVIRELGLEEWLRAMPKGLDSGLESSGGGLSAGEAQLLAFARVFLSDPRLIIMDEASSRLDPATEQLMERAVTRLLEGRTCIIIAHRLTTVQRADQILILEDGRILEYGRRTELATDPDSRFARMLATGLEEVLV